VNLRLPHLESLEKLLVKDCERLSREAKELNLANLDLEDFKLELNEADKMRHALSDRAEMLAVEARAPVRVARLNQDALVAVPDEQARKARFSGLAVVAAVGVVLLCICLVEKQTQRVTSATDVAQVVGMTIVGLLPVYRANRGSLRAAQRLKESVDDARTLLLHHADGRGFKALMITSAASDEGKTSLACHLAASLARAGRRTLLIDADLRKPDAHKVFGLPNTPGLCEVFRGESLLGGAVRDAGLPGLRVLPAGRCDDNALRAVAQGAFHAVLAQVRQEYDFIIIDSSPVLGVPDALMLGKHADGVLFAAMLGESRTNRLAAAADRFSRVDAPILGLVVNGAFDAERGAYGQQIHSLPTASPSVN
jgi:capsular exopolysaccharide synthesis family protein